ncbi:MAG TPA: GNAT family N-acetyltransferase [Bacteriovoracaceae bacterium]|nr:GNAT family N-acetyltransferase [Bacteriovoracaceae bacterium]
MSEIVIKQLDNPTYIKEIRDIFFENSVKKDFKDDVERDAFFWKYVGFYIVNKPEQVFVAVSDKVLGYCLGSTSTYELKLVECQPHLNVFRDQFKEFPAHLHVNCRAGSTGQGIGSRLIKHFENHLQQMNITGVHIVTSPDAENRFFYDRAGYSHHLIRPFSGHDLLLMGKTLKGF